MCAKPVSRVVLAAALFTCLFVLSPHVFAQYTPVYGGPNTYSMQQMSAAGGAVNSSGQVVGYGISGTAGQHALRLGPGGAGIELQPLSSNASGYSESSVVAINDAGQAVGEAGEWAATGLYIGTRPVRWESSGAVTRLGILGSGTSGSAVAINTSGVAVGWVEERYGSTNLGVRAARWDASGAIHPFDQLWTDPSGYGQSCATGINDAGQVCGHAENPNLGGFRAVRWEASGATTVLPSLGESSNGFASAKTVGINGAGQIAGSSWKLDSSGDLAGSRPVRWESSGGITELGTLGLTADGVTFGETYAINDRGEIAGQVAKYVQGVDLGNRPVRWDVSGTVSELEVFGTDPTGRTSGAAYDINAGGWTAGMLESYDADGLLEGSRAVCWRPDGSAIDLNTLIDPLSGWYLLEADAITDTGWIAGLGNFDPDGDGPMEGYDRVFLMQVPEPASVALLAIGGLLVLGRRRATS